MKIVKWSYGIFLNESYIENKELVIGNTSLSIGLYNGLQWSICGLGLTKAERKIFNCKFLTKSDIITVYLGKLIISHNVHGYKNSLKNCKIDWEMKLNEYLRFYFKHTTIPYLKHKRNKLINYLAKKYFFTKKEIFEIQESYHEPKFIRCDKLTAYQLAANYEADLLQNGRYLLSPLGFEWKENKNLIIKNLGKLFNNFNLYGYSNWYDPNIEIIG